MIVTVFNKKGGVGKTTTAFNLVTYMLKNKRDALLLDCDPQKSSSEYVEIRNENKIEPIINCIQKTGSDIANTIKDLSKRYQDIVIDVSGRDSPEARGALLASDILLMPIRASQLDLFVLESTLDIYRQCLMFNEKIKFLCFLNMCHSNYRVTESGDAMDFIKQFDEIILLNGFLVDRKIYRDAVVTGQSVLEFEGKAKTETEALCKEVFSYG